MSYSAQNIRNVCLLGHGGNGKTSLAESMLYSTAELLKNFRISATWTHCGIVFNSPWGIFLQQIEQGYIKQASEEAEAALKGESHETDPV